MRLLWKLEFAVLCGSWWPFLSTLRHCTTSTAVWLRGARTVWKNDTQNLPEGRGSFVKRLCKRGYTGPCVVYKWVIYLYIGAWLLVSSSSRRLLMHGLGGG
jgi:hypothetical protein